MPSSIFLPADERRSQTASCHVLIYFISGNPGLIDFYADFLNMLASMLRASSALESSSTDYDIYGRNLLGFSDDDHEPFGTAKGPAQPWDLEGQVEGVYADVASRRRQGGEPYDAVIMMGHSVGAYIAVEVFARHEQIGQARAPGLDLRNGMLLFPTLTHLAQSPSGRKAALLERVPLLADHAHRIAGWLLAPLPEPLIRWVFQTVCGFTGHAAGVAAWWLKSRDGVWQALHLARSEMRTIREERWEEDLWSAVGGRGGEEEKGPRFYIFYAREDHWVANSLRDEFVQRRKGVARIVVDEGDVPHAFCTREGSSWFIARKVSEWVEEMEAFESA